ncbi:MAG: hypothetical protein ABL877_00700 [Thiobacillus sp.]
MGSSACLIQVGALGWQHPDWQGTFYPDDLPADWQLSYYNTQFQVVYLPAAYWQAATAADWHGWLEDTLPGFHFLLEPGRGVHPVDERIIDADPAWTAQRLWWLDEPTDMRALARRAGEHASTGLPLYTISRTGNLSQMQQVNTLRQVMGY